SLWISQHSETAVGPLFTPEQVEQANRKAQATICLNQIPLFLHDKQKRVGIVLNDQFPSIVTVEPNADRLFLTSNMAFSAGLKKLGPPETVKLPNGHSTKVRLAELPLLRLGSATLQN